MGQWAWHSQLVLSEGVGGRREIDRLSHALLIGLAALLHVGIVEWSCLVAVSVLAVLRCTCVCGVCVCVCVWCVCVVCVWCVCVVCVCVCMF